MVLIIRPQIDTKSTSHIDFALSKPGRGSFVPLRATAKQSVDGSATKTLPFDEHEITYLLN